MPADKSKNDRKKVAIDEEIYDKLVAFARVNAVRTRTVLETLIELALADDKLGQRVVELSLERDADKSE